MKSVGKGSRSYRIMQKKIKSMYTFHLELFGSYFTQTERLSKGCVVTFNKFSRSNVKVIAELYEKSVSNVKCQGHIGSHKNPFLEHIYTLNLALFG